MRPLLVTALFALAVTPLWATDDPEPPAAASKALQGSWAPSAVRLKGVASPLPDETMKKMKFVFIKDTVDETMKKMKFVFIKDTVKMANGRGDDKTMAVKLDAKKKPAHMDFIDKDKKKTIPAIYKVEKGELTVGIRIDPEGKARPKGFDDDDVVVMVFKKEKK